MKNFLICSFILISLVFVSPVLAAGLGDALGNVNTVAGESGVDTSSTLSMVVGTVIETGLSLIGLIFLVLMVYAGFLWMTARGDDGKVETSKKIITAAIIGIVIVVSAYAITYFVVSKLQ